MNPESALPEPSLYFAAWMLCELQNISLPGVTSAQSHELQILHKPDSAFEGKNHLPSWSPLAHIFTLLWRQIKLFFPLFSKLPALKSFARVSGRSTAAISHRGGLSTAGVPGWEQSIAAECGLHCCLSLHTGSCADRHPLCLPAFPPVTAIPASPPAAGGKALALFALPGVFLHPSASLLWGFPCRRDADPAQAGQPQPLPALPPPFPVPERHFLSFLSHTQVSGSINI